MKEITQESTLAALSNHIGRHKGVSARQLVVEITGQADSRGSTRRLRHCIEALREEGSHICGHPGSGYYMAKDEAELTEACEFLVSRAMTSLMQVSRMKKIAIPDIAGQMKLNT